MAKAAHGRADDLLTSTLLTATCPVVYVPAMHTEMWEHPATRDNVAALRARGSVVVEPAVGRLTGPDTGKGRLPEPPAILALLRRVLVRGAAGAAATILPGGASSCRPAGPASRSTRCASSATARAGGRATRSRRLLRRAGAAVVLVSANVALPDPAGVEVLRVGTAVELGAAVRSAAADADVVVMAAAVADFRPAHRLDAKIKKTTADPEPVELVRNPDVLRSLVTDPPRPGQLVVGFAAETGDAHADWLAHGRAKLTAKGCDLLVVNRVGDGLGFEVAQNAAVVLGADGSETEVPLGPKEDLADVVWDLVVARL